MRYIYNYYNVIILLLVILLPVYSSAKSKSDKIRPEWIKNQPRGLNDSYYFKVVEVDNGQNLNSSRILSQKDLVNSIEREFNIKIDEELESQSTTTQSNSDMNFSGKEVYSLKIQSEDVNVKIYYEKIDEYYESYTIGSNQVFKLYTLYAVARSVKKVVFDNFLVTTKYGVRGAWRSMIVPGWGQFYKGSKAKGGVILGSTAALALGAVFSEAQRMDYMKKIDNTHNVIHRRSYRTKADHFTTGRNICIGAVAALYVYNIIDAIVAPGAKRVVVKKQKNLNLYSFTPNIMPDGTVGVNLSFNF